ncbi:hypothetical protein D3C87_1255950 [compost metagenome]
MVARQQRRQVNGGGAVHGAEHEFASRLPPLHRRVGFIVQGEQFGGVVQQDFSRRRQLQPLTLAHEQLNAKLLFELLEPCRQVGWHPVQAFSGPGDGAFFRHRLEDPQLAEFHTFLQIRTSHPLLFFDKESQSLPA